MEEYLDYLGAELCKKIHEVLKKEVEEISDENCKEYIKQLVLDKTYEGYITEKRTVYEYLEEEIGVKLKPAPDEWDRKYNIDFYIRCSKRVYRHTDKTHHLQTNTSDTQLVRLA
jgi:3-hydroxyacyl-CoA dehydrogenase